MWKEWHGLTQSLDFKGRHSCMCLFHVSCILMQWGAQIQGISLEFHGVCIHLYTDNKHVDIYICTHILCLWHVYIYMYICYVHNIYTCTYIQIYSDIYIYYIIYCTSEWVWTTSFFWGDGATDLDARLHGPANAFIGYGASEFSECWRTR